MILISFCRAVEISMLIARPAGFKLSLSRDVPTNAVRAIGSAFNRVLAVLHKHTGLKPRDFDCVIHSGGISIIKGAEDAMGLFEDHLRASYDVYTYHGNASSVAVLAVLERLRDVGNGRDGIMSGSIGPKLTVEMAALQ